MGNSSTQTFCQLGTVVQRYTAIEKAAISPDGRFIFCKVMYDQDHFSPSYILKIDAASSLIVDKMFLNEALIQRMFVSRDSAHIALQTKHNFYVYDWQSKQPIVQLNLRSSWFVFQGDSLYFRTTRGSFSEINFKDTTVRSFLQFDNRVEKISHINVSVDKKWAVFLATFKKKSSNRIIKFDLQQNHISAVYKSSRDIKLLLWIEKLKLIVAGKYSDSLSVYSCESEIVNIKNLSFDGTLISAVSFADSVKIVAFYQCEMSDYFCIWNLETMKLECKISTNLERSSSYFEILSMDTEGILIQSDTEVIRIQNKKPNNGDSSNNGSDNEEQFEFSMKKMKQVESTQKLQNLIVQRSVDLEFKNRESSDDMRLSRVKENESLILNSELFRRTTGLPPKTPFAPKIIDNWSEMDSICDARETTLTKKNVHELRESKLSRLMEDIFPGISVIKQSKSPITSQESPTQPPKRRLIIDASVKKTVLKQSDSSIGIGFLSSIKKHRKAELEDGVCNDDIVTVKNDRSSLCLERNEW